MPPLWVGISAHGVNISEKRVSSREMLQEFPWQFIQKISFNRKRFSILPKSEAGPVRNGKLNFYSDSFRK